MVNVEKTFNVYLKRDETQFINDVVAVQNHGYIPAYVSITDFTVDNNGIMVDTGKTLSFIKPKNIFIRAHEDTVVVVAVGEAGSAEIETALTAEEKQEIILGANFGEGNERCMVINEEGFIETPDCLLNVIEYPDDTIEEADILDLFGMESVCPLDITPNIVEDKKDEITYLQAWDIWNGLLPEDVAITPLGTCNGQVCDDDDYEISEAEAKEIFDEI